MDWRHQKERANARKSCDLRSNNFRETGPVLGKQAQNLCVSTQSYFSQTYRFRTTGPKQIRIEHCGGTLIGLVQVNGSPDPTPTARILSPHPPCGGVQVHPGIIESGEGFFPVGRATEILIEGSAGGTNCLA